jgi:hypothetical protein
MFSLIRTNSKEQRAVGENPEHHGAFTRSRIESGRRAVERLPADGQWSSLRPRFATTEFKDRLFERVEKRHEASMRGLADWEFSRSIRYIRFSEQQPDQEPCDKTRADTETACRTHLQGLTRNRVKHPDSTKPAPHQNLHDLGEAHVHTTVTG